MKTSLKHMRPMEIHQHITSNTQICQECKLEKKLSLFWDDDSKIVDDVCRKCQKKIKEREIFQIVLGVLKDKGL